MADPVSNNQGQEESLIGHLFDIDTAVEYWNSVFSDPSQQQQNTPSETTSSYQQADNRAQALVQQSAAPSMATRLCNGVQRYLNDVKREIVAPSGEAVQEQAVVIARKVGEIKTKAGQKIEETKDTVIAAARTQVDNILDSGLALLRKNPDTLEKIAPYVPDSLLASLEEVIDQPSKPVCASRPAQLAQQFVEAPAPQTAPAPKASSAAAPSAGAAPKQIAQKSSKIETKAPEVVSHPEQEIHDPQALAQSASPENEALAPASEEQAVTAAEPVAVQNENAEASSGSDPLLELAFAAEPAAEDVSANAADANQPENQTEEPVAVIAHLRELNSDSASDDVEIRFSSEGEYFSLTGEAQAGLSPVAGRDARIGSPQARAGEDLGQNPVQSNRSLAVLSPALEGEVIQASRSRDNSPSKPLLAGLANFVQHAIAQAQEGAPNRVSQVSVELREVKRGPILEFSFNQQQRVLDRIQEEGVRNVTVVPANAVPAALAAAHYAAHRETSSLMASADLATVISNLEQPVVGVHHQGDKGGETGDQGRDRSLEQIYAAEFSFDDQDPIDDSWTSETTPAELLRPTADIVV